MIEPNWMELKRILKEEIEAGGELKDLPCPFCKLPRSQRSDYIRCCRCGINWLVGEDLSKNPTIERYKKMVQDAPKKSPQSVPIDAPERRRG